MKVAGAGGVGSALGSCFVLDGLGLGAALGEALAAGGGPEKRARLPCEGLEVDEEAAAGLEGPGAEEGALRLAICCSRLKLRGERGRQSWEVRPVLRFAPVLKFCAWFPTLSSSLLYYSELSRRILPYLS